MGKWEGGCFCLIPGHVGIRENPAADSAAKDVLNSDISVELIPFLDFKPTNATVNKYISYSTGSQSGTSILSTSSRRVFQR